MSSPELGSFLNLSRYLTAEKVLDAAIGQEYLDRLLVHPSGTHLSRLLNVWQNLPGSPHPEKAVFDATVMADADLSSLVGDTLTLWFSSALTTNGSTWIYGTPEAYFTSLLWPTIGAHVPGLSGGYHGHWRYPPDNG